MASGISLSMSAMRNSHIALRQSLQPCRCFHTHPRLLRPAAGAQASLEAQIAYNEQAILQTKRELSPEESSKVLRTYKPRTPGIRHLKRPINDHLYKGRAFLPLTVPRRGNHIGGRNSHTGQISVRHKGGGHKRRIRTVDFQRQDPGVQVVERIEHDPGRNAHIALLSRVEGDKRHYSYIVAPEGMRAGEETESFMAGIPERLMKDTGGNMDIGLLAARTVLRGNCLPLHMIPAGTVVYNLGLKPLKGAQLCRSAGTYATILGQFISGAGQLAAKEGKLKAKFVNVRLKSGEVRRIDERCCATIGVASNANFHRRSLGKAGRKRWLGIRPTVRGVAMNACDHPHGGGRGKSKGGVPSVSIWGQLTKGGFKTRRRKNVNKFLIKERPRRRDKVVAKTKKKAKE